jgi:hypothetical protein
MPAVDQERVADSTRIACDDASEQPVEARRTRESVLAADGAIDEATARASIVAAGGTGQKFERM